MNQSRMSKPRASGGGSPSAVGFGQGSMSSSMQAALGVGFSPRSAAGLQCTAGNSAVAEAIAAQSLAPSRSEAEPMAAAQGVQGDSEHPIARDAKAEEWSALRREVAAFEKEDASALVRETNDPEALAAGKTLSATESREDGMIEEMTTGIVNVPFAEFTKKVFPADWGKNLYAYEGGEVDVEARDEQGRPKQQEERMVLETPMSKYLDWMGSLVPAFRDLDMTKTEEIEYGEKSARVRWRVYMSDNDTVAQDIGYVNFEAAGQGTKVTFHSAHKYTGEYTWPLNWGPLKALRDALTAKGLRDYFTGAIDHYRELAGG